MTNTNTALTRSFLSACMLLGCGNATDGELDHFDSVDVEQSEQALSGIVDYCGDWGPDLLWHNGISGRTQAWCMNAGGTTRQSAFDLDPSLDVPDSSNWKPVGIVPFAGDDSGIRKDIVWHNGVTGQTQVWSMAGDYRYATAQFDSSLNVADNTGWTIVATNDFDNDRVVDIVWHNGISGANQIWLMNNDMKTRKSFANFGWGVPDSTGWRVVGSSNLSAFFDSNRSPDLLWHNRVTGELAVWFMTGTKQTGLAYFPATLNTPDSGGWRPIVTNDFDRDGLPDILWHNGITGQSQVWYLSGLNLRGKVNFPSTLNVADSTGWRIIAQ